MDQGQSQTIDKLRELFADHIKNETLNNQPIEIIEFFDDTLKNLKPIFEKYKATLEFDKKDENSRFNCYIPLIDFYNTFEPALLDAGESLEDILLTMMAYDRGHKLGFSMFLNMVRDKRNPEPEILKTFQIVESKPTRKHY